MGKSYVESSLKRFLKRKVKVTLGLVVAFMISGNIGYAEKVKILGDSNGITISHENRNDKPFTGVEILETDMFFEPIKWEYSNVLDFTKDTQGNNVETQVIKGETVKKGIKVSESTTNGTQTSYGLFTTGGVYADTGLNIKFNNMVIDLEQNPKWNGAPGQAISGHENGKNLTFTGNNLSINILQKESNGSSINSEFCITSAIYSKNGGGVEINSDKTIINIISYDKEKIQELIENNKLSSIKDYQVDASGITAENKGNITINGDLDITINSGNKGYGIVTNRTGKIVLNGKTNVITVNGFDKSPLDSLTTTLSGIEAINDEKTAKNENSIEIKGENGNTIIKVSDKDGNNITSMSGINGSQNILIENQNILEVTTNSNYKGKYLSRNIGILLNREAELKADSKIIRINVISTGKAHTYGMTVENSKTFSGSYSSGKVNINQGKTAGDTFVSAVSTGTGKTYGLRAEGDKGEINIGGNYVEINSSAEKNSAYGLVTDNEADKGNEDYNTEDTGKIVINSNSSKIFAESKGTSYNKKDAYALYNLEGKNGEISVEGNTHIEAKSAKGKAYAIYAQHDGIIKVNESNSENKVTIIGDIKSGNYKTGGQAIVNLNGELSFLKGNVDIYSLGTKENGSTKLGIYNNATWYNEGNSRVTDFNFNKGITDMTYEAEHQTIEVDKMNGNGGTFIMDISTEDIDQSGKKTDFLKIKESEQGRTHYIGIGKTSLDGLKNYDFDNSNPDKAIWFADTDKNVTFEGKEFSSLANIYNYTLELDTNMRDTDTSANGTNWYITGVDKKENEVPQTVIDDISFLYEAAISRLELDTLHKRMGEIRNYENAQGVWFRTSTGELKSDVSDSSFENDYYMLQVGYDKKKVSDKGDWFTGFAVSRRENDIDFRNGDGESENIGLSLYKSFAGKDNTYFDLIGKYTNFDIEYRVHSNSSEMKADYDTWSGTLSVEYGKKYTNRDDKWYVTPHAQLNYTYVNGEDYRTSTDVKVEQDNIDSLIGRIGIYAGKDFEKSSHYLKASVLSEFMGDYGATIKGADASLTKEIDGKDTWTEVGIGGNFQVGNSGTTHIYYDVERTFGSRFETQWQGTLGFRISFDKLSDLFTSPIEAPVTIEAANLFDFDKTEVKPAGKEMIKNASEIMNAKKLKGTLLIEGHTDWTGSEEYNQILSEKRAKAVEEVFKENVTNENIKYETKGYGETRPVADNKIKEGRAANRRVEMKFNKN